MEWLFTNFKLVGPANDLNLPWIKSTHNDDDYTLYQVDDYELKVYKRLSRPAAALFQVIDQQAGDGCQVPTFSAATHHRIRMYYFYTILYNYGLLDDDYDDHDDFMQYNFDEVKAKLNQPKVEKLWARLQQKSDEDIWCELANTELENSNCPSPVDHYQFSNLAYGILHSGNWKFLADEDIERMALGWGSWSHRDTEEYIPYIIGCQNMLLREILHNGYQHNCRFSRITELEMIQPWFDVDYKSFKRAVIKKGGVQYNKASMNFKGLPVVSDCTPRK